MKNKIRFTQSAQRVSQRTAKGFCLALRFFALPFSLRPLRERYLSKNSSIFNARVCLLQCNGGLPPSSRFLAFKLHDYEIAVARGYGHSGAKRGRLAQTRHF